ncbi:MAG: hypothetical protein CMP41_03605, partial [Rickettsiales bacterium]|nr:hypothetical protein [Rickettsiales bacterium]
MFLDNFLVIVAVLRKYKNKPLLISSLLPKVLNPIKKKFSSNLFELEFHWEDILGKELANKCYPSKFYKKNNFKTLEISINGNYALEFSYYSAKIKEKINTFFKYDYINVI